MSTTLTITDEMRAQVLAELQASQEAAEAHKKEQRETSKELTSDFVARVVDNLDVQTFQSGAQGYSLGGKFTIKCENVWQDESGQVHADEIEQTYRVSVLIRDEATIPAKEK